MTAPLSGQMTDGLARQDVDHLIEIIHMVNRYSDEDELIQNVLHRLMQIGVASFVIARRLSDDGSVFVPVAQLEEPNDDPLVATLANFAVPAVGSFEGYALDTRQALVVDSEVGSPPMKIDPDYLETVMFVAQRGATGGYFFPMLANSPIGVITFYSDIESDFDIRRQQLVASAVRVLSFGVDKCRMLRTLDDQQAALTETADRLAASNRDLQDFAYVASHDLQEPLRKIQAFGDRLEGLAADRLDQTGMHCLARMQSSSRSMQAVIQDLLRFSRINSCELDLVRVGIGDLVAAATQTITGALRSAGATIEVSGEAELLVDRRLGEQLIRNLVDNAMKNRSPDRPLRLNIYAESADTNKTVVSISDNGLGFHHSLEKRIFDPFFRLDNESDTAGSGIGLALCRRIVERHSGSIEATGSEGVGATISFSLPALVERSPESPPRNEDQQ